MANILGIIGLNRKRPINTVNLLLAAYGNDVVSVDGTNGYSQNISKTNNVEFATFMDNVFMENYFDQPRNFDSFTWGTNLSAKMPVAKYLYPWKNRLYAVNCQLPSVAAGHKWDAHAIGNVSQSANNVLENTTFPSSVFYSNLPKNNKQLSWGLYWDNAFSNVLGTNNLSTLLSLPATASTGFIDAGLKVGDPITFVDYTTSLSQNGSFIQSINSNTQLTMTDAISNVPNSGGWIGSNFFNVGTESNDELTGVTDNFDRLILFKLFSLWFYTGTQLRQVYKAPGTSSHRSIINKRKYTYYFHGSDPLVTGIYRYDGVESIKISINIDPYIQGMDPTNYPKVVAWEEGDEIKFFLGNLTNTNRGISLTNAVASYHAGTQSWSVGPIADVITCASPWVVANVRNYYAGTTNSQVMKMGSGNSHNGTPIRFNLESKVYYPEGTKVTLEYKRFQVVGRQTKGIKVRMRLWDTPINVGEWVNIGELENDLTELLVPRDYRMSSGFQLGFYEDGTLENDLYIEKITPFYIAIEARLAQNP